MMSDVGIDHQSGLFIKNLYQNLPEMLRYTQYEGDVVGERKLLSNKQRKKKKSINKQARKSRKKNRK